ncbi:MAG: ATP-dependent helicase, partial [Kiritimatiellaeota bacterium]|nr:ATP-dependent helicase [Kiritimatiellota bacterium]
DFTILDADEQKSIIAAIMKTKGLTAKEFMKKEVLLGLVSHARNRRQELDDFLEGRIDPVEVDPAQIVAIAREYEKRKGELKAMDFDDLLINALRLLREHEEVRLAYQRQFRHVLVDEFQDTNILQAEFTEMLAREHGNLSVVGDDFQCIYSWRGADFRNIMEFPKRHPDAKIIKLEQNYRSVPGILELANACIAGNPGQFQKTLRSTRPATHPPRRHDVFDGEEQTSAIMALIRRYRDAGYRCRDMAVLYRAHFHSIELQIALTRMRIPHRITSGVGVFEQAHVKDVLCLFRMAENPTDRLAFDRLICLLKGAGEGTAKKLWEKYIAGAGSAHPHEHPASLATAEGLATLEKALPDKLIGQWRPFHDFFSRYVENRAHPGGLITAFVTDFYRDYLGRTHDNPREREDDIGELAALLERAGDIRTFLSEVALLTNLDHQMNADAAANPDDQLTLSTVHQAKGLEWPVVFIPWVVQNMFPSAKALSDETAEGEAEERRLFYVAVTRAKDELHLFAPRYRYTRDGGGYPCDPSVFITELPPALLTHQRGIL